MGTLARFPVRLRCSTVDANGNQCRQTWHVEPGSLVTLACLRCGRTFRNVLVKLDAGETPQAHWCGHPGERWRDRGGRERCRVCGETLPEGTADTRGAKRT